MMTISTPPTIRTIKVLSISIPLSCSKMFDAFPGQGGIQTASDANIQIPGSVTCKPESQARAANYAPPKSQRNSDYLAFERRR
jgi:hypothetical protein